MNIKILRYKQSFCFTDSDTLIALVAIFVGIFLRFNDLDYLSLWSDELFSVATALDVGKGKHWYDIVPKVIQELDYGDSFLTWKAADNTPPLFEGVLFFWALVFGDSDFSLRSLNAFLGSLVPIIFYFSIRRSIGSHSALIGTIFLAFSPSAIYYSQEVRAYGLAVFFATIAVTQLVSAIAHEYGLEPVNHNINKNNRISYHVIILLFLSYSHYTGLFLAGLIAGIYLSFISIPRRKYSDIMFFLLIPALVLPWIYLSFKAFKFSSEGGYAWRDYTITDVYQIMIPQAADFFMPNFGMSLILIALLFVVISIIILTREGFFNNSISISFINKRIVKIVLNLLLIFSVLFLFFYSVYNAFTSKMWHPRYFAVALPVFAASLSIFYSIITTNKRRIWIFTFPIIAVVSVNFYFEINEKAPKEQYREAALFISDQIQPGDVIIIGWTPSEALYRHYLDKFTDSDIDYSIIGVRTLGDASALCDKLEIGPSYFVFQHAHQSKYFKALEECKFETESVAKVFYNILVYKFTRL
ncbi:TPA: glycosyltransferase family 39 protein [Vibrio cholerae]|nr:glycosyltransferase family 39 protein [Vibrio cholerae]